MHWQRVAEERARQEKRSNSLLPQRRTTRPVWWALDEGFNPYLVRARSARVAHSLHHKLGSRSYQPRAPLEDERPKPGGGSRTVSIYQVGDSALSKLVFESLLAKNGPTLGARAYAYRKDVTSQDAIQFIKASFSGRHRLFIAEYDFSSYFDNIDHEHVRKVLRDRFLVSAEERSVVEGFLRVGGRPGNEYEPVGPLRSRGIPQGTSISLLLASAAAWNLDRMLEGCGVNFVRYADDTLIWGSEYNSVTEAVALLHNAASEMGVSVNTNKSPGIRLLMPRDSPTGELESTASIEYLGYKIALDQTAIRAKAVARMKGRLQGIIYWTLLFELGKKSQNVNRLSPTVDKDYVTCIWQLRRYLYGDLSEKALVRYKNREVPLRRFRGVMSAYPLIDDTTDLKTLDSWLSSQLWLAVRRRGTLFKQAGTTVLPVPYGLGKTELLTASAKSSTTGQTIDLTIPSFRRIAALHRKAIDAHGLRVAAAPDDYEY
jgi:RNA-directed DNA polymerase